jgi:hypothetical protein
LGCSDRGLHFQLKIAPLPEMDEEAIFMLIDLIRSAQKDDEHAMLQLINRFDKLFQKYGRKLTSAVTTRRITSSSRMGI